MSLREDFAKAKDTAEIEAIYEKAKKELKTFHASDEYEINSIMEMANIQWEWEEAKKNGKDVSYCKPCGTHHYTHSDHDCTRTWWYKEGYKNNPNPPQYKCRCEKK